MASSDWIQIARDGPKPRSLEQTVRRLCTNLRHSEIALLARDVRESNALVMGLALMGDLWTLGRV
jgi:hypothetical protein